MSYVFDELHKINEHALKKQDIIWIKHTDFLTIYYLQPYLLLFLAFQKQAVPELSSKNPNNTFL